MHTCIWSRTLFLVMFLHKSFQRLQKRNQKCLSQSEAGTATSVCRSNRQHRFGKCMLSSCLLSIFLDFCSADSLLLLVNCVFLNVNKTLTENNIPLSSVRSYAKSNLHLPIYVKYAFVVHAIDIVDAGHHGSSRASFFLFTRGLLKHYRFEAVHTSCSIHFIS